VSFPRRRLRGPTSRTIRAISTQSPLRAPSSRLLIRRADVLAGKPARYHVNNASPRSAVKGATSDQIGKSGSIHRLVVAPERLRSRHHVQLRIRFAIRAGGPPRMPPPAPAKRASSFKDNRFRYENSRSGIRSVALCDVPQGTLTSISIEYSSTETPERAHSADTIRSNFWMRF
jgi:hypothetical protein